MASLFYQPISSFAACDFPRLTPRRWIGQTKKKARRNFFLRAASSSPATDCGMEFDLKVMERARENFKQEISFRSMDKDISIAKALLFVAAEDEALLSYHRTMDARSFQNERGHLACALDADSESNCLDAVPLAGKSISWWLDELDLIAKEVEAELVSRDIGCHLFEILDAVNAVIFQSRSFKRHPVLVDTKFSYLHAALSSGNASAIMLSVIYIEVCRRLGIDMVGSPVGEDFLIWPQTGNLEELFKVSSGSSLFATINGRCVKDPKSKAFDIDSESLKGLDTATNRDIIGIALANLIRLYWKRASRTNHGLMLNSPLRPVFTVDEKFSIANGSKVPLLRPRYLRLAIMACERLLILQPDNWSLRKEHGLLLYYSRRYGEAVQELSICMAFAPVEEAEVLQPFVQKLHLLRLEASWEAMEKPNQLTVS